MKLNSVQVLRAIAALLVVYAHAIDLQMQFSVSHQQNFFHLQDFGAIGVDLFFVISGFIITYVADQYKGRKQGCHFLAKRFKRINPLYYLASIIYLGLHIFFLLLSAGQHTIYWREPLNALANTLMIIPRTGNIDSFNTVLYIGWTLSFEWLFYFLFFFTILSGTRHKSLLLGLLVMGLVTLGYLFKLSDIRFKFLTNPIMLEFLIGVAICQIGIYMKKRPSWIPAILLLIGITGYLLMIVFGYGQISVAMSVFNTDISGKRFLWWGIPSALIVFGCIYLEKNNRLTKLWNNKLLVLTGDASYSIYLVHLIIFDLFTRVYNHWGFFIYPDLAIIVQVGIAALAGIGFYKWVEKPLLLSKRRPSRNKSTKIPTPIDTPAPEAVS